MVKIKNDEKIDQSVEKIIEIFNQEIYWQQLIDNKTEENNVLGRLRVRITDIIREFLASD